MHETSFDAMKYLAQCMSSRSARKRIKVLDVGSMVVMEGQTSYRSIFEALGGAEYTGLDMAPGKNVDIVAEDPYRFPLESASYDLIISGQAFEHIEFPWLTIREIARVLRPAGTAIVIAPSSGPEHRFPQDCWRFYPDGMRALARWAGLECVDAVTNWAETKHFGWGDTIGVFSKRESAADRSDRPLLSADDLRYAVQKAWGPAAPPGA